MLPSAGMLSNIPCPYFEEGHCVRPFCEFLHRPPNNDGDKIPERPTYRPTPISYSVSEAPPEEIPVKKKPRLEYLPLPISIKPVKPVYKPSVISRDNRTNVPAVATYIPTKIIPKVEELKVEETENSKEELHEETPEAIEKSDDDKDLIIVEPADQSDSNVSLNGHSSGSDKKLKKSSHRHSHSSSKSSSSSSRHHKSSRHESSSSRHKSSRHKSSRSSGSSKESSRKHSRKSDEKIEKETSEIEVIKKLEEQIEIKSSDEEDIEEQCRMIFETYEPPTESQEISQQPKSSKSSDSEENSSIGSANDKKRLAHENAATISRPSATLKPNHSQSAVALALKRQEIAMQNAKEELKRKNEEIQRLEAEIKKNQEENEKKLTPLINPLVFQRAKPRPVISKVSQIMVIEAAKKRVADLQKSKMERFQSFTTSQTASKSANRTAHIPTNISDIDPVRLAPPLKEPNSSKISSNIRNQYYKIMVTHCLQIYSLPEDSYERAQNEEFTVFQKCKLVQTYKTSALLTISRLKKEAESCGDKKNQKTFSHDVMLAGKQGLKASWSQNHKIKVANSDSALVTIDNCSSSQAFALFEECILTEQQLKDNGFPRATSHKGRAQLFTPKKAKPQNGKEGDYYCSRCHKVFNVEIYDEPSVDSCNYHAKRSGYRRGFADNLYYCCQQPVGSGGCGYANYHVTDYFDHDNLIGYVSTMDKDDDYVCTKKDIFALDCEMCYTVAGLELTRITVIGFDERVVYDKFVKPQNRVIDYNTKFSGITEQTLNAPGVKTITEIQAVLLSMFHSRTILVGHSLESDLKALKLIHDKVVDTSVLYPHKMGPPKKRALKTLCNEYLKKIIQEDEAGHDSSEDALVTLQLVKCYLRNRIVN